MSHLSNLTSSISPNSVYSTSDHGFQSIRVIDGRTEVRGLTWNLLNKGHDRSVSGYSNNPFNLNESEEAYLERKKVQLNFLNGHIQACKLIRKELDFIFLQEVNMFTDKEQEQIQELKQIIDLFIAKLHKQGWGLAITCPASGCKPLVILYNSNTLELDKKKVQILFKDKENIKSTGMELTFFHRKSQKPICLTNIHLDYNKDYSEEITQYQFDQIAQGIFTIIGGDCNHAPSRGRNHGVNGFTGNLHHSTCISKDRSGQITTISERFVGERITMHHDGFFCSPAGKENFVTIEENLSIYFEIKNGRLKILKEDPSKKERRLEVGKTGLPWFRPEEAFYMLPIPQQVRCLPTPPPTIQNRPDLTAIPTNWLAAQVALQDQQLALIKLQKQYSQLTFDLQSLDQENMPPCDLGSNAGQAAPFGGQNLTGWYPLNPLMTWPNRQFGVGQEDPNPESKRAFHKFK